MATQDEGTQDTGDKDPADMTSEELEAAQRAEDGEDENMDDSLEGDDTQAGVEQPTPTPAPPPATPAPTSAPAAAQDAGAKDEKPKGVASKDGSSVIPYSALQAERRAARAAAGRASALEKELATAKQQLEDFRAGKAPKKEVTEEDVRQMEADYPEDGAKYRQLFEEAQAAKAAAAAAPKPPVNDDDDPVLKTQELIDTIPTLLQWQHEDGREKFDRVCDVDALYAKSPKWKDKPVIERFEAATKFVADEYGVEYEGPAKPKASTEAAAPAAKPAAAPTAAAPIEPARKNPETLSDFKHGTTPDHGTADWSRMAPHVGVNRMLDMSDDEIDAHLAKHG
jgi:hypothetical protein